MKWWTSPLDPNKSAVLSTRTATLANGHYIREAEPKELYSAGTNQTQGLLPPCPPRLEIIGRKLVSGLRIARNGKTIGNAEKASHFYGIID